MTADERTDIADMTNNWLSASDAARKAEHHYPADCLAEAVIAYRALRHELDAARATIQRVTALVREWMPIETCENFGQPYDCISDSKTFPCHNCRMREEFRAVLAPATDTTEAS